MQIATLIMVLLLTPNVVYASRCDEIASLIPTLQAGVLATNSEKVTATFSERHTLYTRALALGRKLVTDGRAEFNVEDQCEEISGAEATEWLLATDSWYVRRSTAMTSALERMLPLGTFAICHTRFNAEEGPWSGVMHDAVKFTSSDCPAVRFAFGMRERWQE